VKRAAPGKSEYLSGAPTPASREIAPRAVKFITLNVAAVFFPA